MNHKFPEVKKNFGFGCMRLPMAGGEVDLEETCRMVDAFWPQVSITLTPHTAISEARAKPPCAAA